MHSKCANANRRCDHWKYLRLMWKCPKMRIQKTRRQNLRGGSKTQSRVLKGDWLIVEHNEKATLNIDMHYCWSANSNANENQKAYSDVFQSCLDLHSRGGKICILMFEFAIESQSSFVSVVCQSRTEIIYLAETRLAR